MRGIYEDVLNKHLSAFKKMAFIMRPRQVGKTTIGLNSGALWGAHHYLNWDNSAERLLFLEGPAAIAAQAHLEELSETVLLLLFDEIHKFEKWKDFLQGFFDKYEKRVRVSVAELLCPHLIEQEIRDFPRPIFQRSKRFFHRLQSIRRDQLFHEDIRDRTRIQEIAQM